MSCGVFTVPRLILLVAGAVLCASLPAQQGTAPRVCIQDGCIRGTRMNSTSGDPFEAFLGIPFAKPPVGELRFADPVPNVGWAYRKIDLDATGAVPRAVCMQLNTVIPGSKVEGSEDCLYLNVYRPSQVAKDGLASATVPTVVYIHGGAYMFGTNSPQNVGPERLMDHPVILVTITYRVGALGFLSTGDEAASGNFGLKDQQLALRWVNRNIAAFGGDPQLVTIMGQSAGASSVQLHMMHQANDGLFQRAISLSGSALAPWSAPRPNPERTARQQATLLGIERANTMSTAKLVKALRAIAADRIAGSYSDFMNGSRYPMLVYGPVVEKPTTVGAFLTENPQKLWSRGAFLNVPWLTGIVPNEGFTFSSPLLMESTCTRATYLQQQVALLALLGTPKNLNGLPQLKERFYPEAPTGECFTRHNVNVLMKIFDEGEFLYPLTVSAQQFLRRKLPSNTSRAPIYLYKFNYRGTLSYSLAFTTADFGVVHSDDLLYIFRSPALFPDFPPNSPDANASRRLTKFLVDFARTGDVTERPANDESVEIEPTDDEGLPPAIEFFNDIDPLNPLGLRATDLYDAEMVQFWTRFFSSA